jgi:hypothetical protein
LGFPSLARETKCKNRARRIDAANDKKQMQVLRLTTPHLHPSDEDLSLGTPELKNAWGPFSLRMTDFY